MVKRGGATKRKSPSDLPNQITVVGIDPGFAKRGIGVIRKETSKMRTESRVVCLETKLLVTKKGTGKRVRDFRVSDDDLRRMTEIYQAIAGIVAQHNPMAIAYEVYSAYSGQGGNAWEVARAEGIIVSVALESRVVTFPFVPQDLKRRIAGKLSASKKDVEKQVRSSVVGAGEAIDVLAKTNREHVADALGLAYLGLLEVEALRSVLHPGEAQL